MSRRRKHSPIKFKLREDLVYTIAGVVFFILSGLVMLSFRGQGYVYSVLNMLLRRWFGSTALLIPFLLFCAGLMLTRVKWAFGKAHVFLGGVILFLGSLSLFSTGSFGLLLFESLAKVITAPGAGIVSVGVVFTGILLMTDTSLGELLHFLASIFELVPAVQNPLAKANEKDQKDEENKVEKDGKGLGLPLGIRPTWSDQKIDVLEHTSAKAAAEPVPKKTGGLDPEKKIEVLPTAASEAKQIQSAQKPAAVQEPLAVWTLPPVSLLDPKTGGKADRGDVNTNANIIEKTLDAFGISARVVDFKGGPAVTQYCLQIGTGTKLSKVTSLANDLALALAAPTGQIRIEAPIPGTSWVGIEIPNISSEFVTLRTMLISEEMKKVNSKLAVALGLNVSGKPVVIDIARMPHALIAGATGSGKSVAINAFIASILFRASPDEVKFIMIDPKRVELSQYNDIPHLITPVITEANKVLGTLTWAVDEMTRRYKLFAEVGVRNIEAFNEMSGFTAMNYIVIVIDELADIMLLAPAPVEEAITRLAQMARAVGIHLILATQRPSVNVITGLIKANIPTRIAFNVSSMIDSRVILDTPGAEKLLGRGDMLYIPPEQAKPTRVQGTFVSDHEIRKLIDFIKAQGRTPAFVEEIAQKYQTTITTSGTAKESASADKDEQLMFDAIAVIMQYNKASVSVLQRRLALGYGRAARIMDMLAEEGIVSAQDTPGKGREIFVARAQEFLAQREAAV
ncbi:MAG: DNA translocase FtsK [Candidatus Woesebacteria bacterium]